MYVSRTTFRMTNVCFDFEELRPRFKTLVCPSGSIKKRKKEISVKRSKSPKSVEKYYATRRKNEKEGKLQTGRDRRQCKPAGQRIQNKFQYFTKHPAGWPSCAGSSEFFLHFFFFAAEVMRSRSRRVCTCADCESPLPLTHSAPFAIHRSYP